MMPNYRMHRSVGLRVSEPGVGPGVDMHTSVLSL